MKETTTHGLWSEPTIPKRGWTLRSTSDLGAPIHQCEMCQLAVCRYVHTVTHPQSKTLLVGCVCCDHLTGSKVAARIERLMKNRAQRRAGFCARKWRQSRNGHLVLRHQGERVTVYQGAYGGWSFACRGQYHGKWYQQVQDAQLALFDHLEPWEVQL